MSAPKWTPGPWSVGIPNNDTSADAGVHAGEWVIADICNDVDELTINQKANAHLIAAAPELYEALEECMLRLEDDDRHINILGKWNSCYAKARAALAKARGES